MTELDSNADIDDALYSRQRYVLGDKAMNRMKDSNVAIFSMKSLGVEIAKNVVLAGIKSLSIHDSGVVEAEDLSGQFFLKDKDIGSNRATVTATSLQELNPYVRVSVHSANVTPLASLPLSAFDGYQCVVIADWAPHATLVAIDQHVRAQGNRFIWAWSKGLFASMFTDFGDQFEIYDANGEAAVSRLINRIDKRANPDPDSPAQLVVVCIRPHNLSTGDWITISEVTGLEGLNGEERQVADTINANSFVIEQGDGVSGDFRWGGVVTQVKKTVVRSYQPLQEQLLQPTISETSDFGKFCHPYALLALTRALDCFYSQNNRLPRVRNPEDITSLQAAVAQVFTESPDLETAYRNCFYSPEQQAIPAQQIDPNLLHAFAATVAHTLPAISAYHGGVVGQEVLKAVSGKFSPYNQWCFYDCVEMFEQDRPAEDYTIQPEDNARDAHLIAILGRETTQLLASLRIFLIGAGAIGCEMLKNLAMHSVATSGPAKTDDSAATEGGGEGDSTKKKKGKGDTGGAVIVTDPDVIEKSNLNRQFLFRSSDIQKHKSEAACAAAVTMHPGIRTDARLDRVGPESEAMYTDTFYSNLDVCINALDNVQARLYVDQRCVVAQRPLIDSGTLGTKGHTQIVVPHLTESYGSTRDPAEEQVPFCTLRSFPNNINHTIQWARDRFEKLYNLKPLELNVYLQQQEPIASLSYNESEALSIASARRSLKQLQRLPRTFADVVVHARHKFDKLFNHAARNLLQAFPPDLKDANGIPFWSLPKRQPTPLTFNPDDSLHANFVYHSACVWAAVYGISIGTPEEAVEVCRTTPELPWVPKDKSDATIDPTAAEVDPETADTPVDQSTSASINEISDQEVRDLITQLNTALSLGDTDSKTTTVHVHPQQFEKDDDSNHHIDFISAAANLRARVYGITEVDRLQVKLVAGKITPAIATTTAAVSGLVTVELIKLVQAQLQLARTRATPTLATSNPPARLLADLTPSDQLNIELFRCAFINLAIPIQALSEPMPCARTKVTDEVSVSLWDRWEIRKGKNMTVQEFIDAVASKYGIKATAVIQGAKMIWVSLFPAHKKRLDKKLRKQLDEVDTKYVDLTLSCTDAQGNDIDNTPPVRFWLTSK